MGRSKMIKNLIKSLLFIILFVIISTITQANSTNTFVAIVTPADEKVKPGEEITLTISVSDINMGEDGINTLEGTIEYDKEVFEEIKNDDIKSINNWTTTYNDERSMLNGKFLSVNLTEGVKEDTSIFRVTMKVKDTIEKTISTKVNFKDLTSNNGTDLVNVGTKTANITIEVEKEEENNKTNNNVIDNELSVGQSQTENKLNSTNVNKLDDTQTNNKIPFAGKCIYIIGIIFLISIIAVYLWIKRLGLKDI